MKLHVKLGIYILLGLSIIIVIAQVIQYFVALSLISNLSKENITLLKDREEQAVRNLFHSVERSVSGSLERGEMEKFTKLLEDQKDVAGLLEFSLYNQQGVVTHSSDPAFVEKSLPEELHARLLTEPSQLLRYAGGAMEIYQPQRIEQDCIRCHQTWDVGKICGVTSMRFSTNALTVSEQRSAKIIAQVKQAFMINSVAGWVGIVLVFMLTMYLAVRKFVKQPLSYLIEELHDLSIGAGDLTKRLAVTSNDDIGLLSQLFNTFMEQLQAMIGHIQRSGIQVTSSATELAATSKQQEVTMKTQMESINAVVRSIQEISEIAGNLVHTMQDVAAMLQDTVGFASQGQSNLARMDSAVQQMEEASKSISAKLHTINEKADNITLVVTTITKVADQTNLLSLNAAIEAEKAGEYGRGFTVVAREIRRLADQTAVATLDIDRMVGEMQASVSSGVMEMDKFIQEVQHSADDIEHISTHLANIIEQVQQLSPRFDEVNGAMELQSGKAHDINRAMAGLSEEMHETTDSLRESFLAIGQLKEAAKDLQELVSQFTVS